MSRFFAIFPVLLLALYGNLPAMATDREEHPRTEIVPEPAIVSHIALMLPLESPAFAEAANVVKEGFVTATQRGQALSLPVRIYATTGDPLDILIGYHHAVSAGAAFVVGPLTRDGVSAIASSQSLEVPVLALNTVDNNQTLPAKLYLFGLQTETEADQIAKLAQSSNDRNHAIVIGDDGSLSKRLQNAFMQQWQHQAGNTAELIRYTDNPELLQHLRSLTEASNQLVFLALDAAQSRIVRAFLAPETPVYATSQIFTGSGNFLLNSDLNGIQFVDMPWLLQPDHPAVMAYRHGSTARSADMERLYALGIDAFRLMANLLLPQPVDAISIDGVTGNIRFATPGLFIREPVAAQFEQGQVKLLNTTQKDIAEHEGQ